MNTVASLLVLLAVAAASGSSIPGFVAPGKCPSLGNTNLRVDQTIHFGNFSGLWYEYSVTKNPIQPSAKCVRHDYAINGNQFKFISTGITSGGLPYSSTGKFYPNPQDESELTIDIDNSYSAPLHILDTDYKNYACIYSCVDFSFGRYTDIAFVMGRYPYLTSDYARKCYAIFKTINVDVSRFTKTHQGHPCLYEKQKIF